MATITSANSDLLIGVTGLYTLPQRLDGFGSDDAYSVDMIDPVEAIMGVDGKMSAGWTPQIKVMHINLQADSRSNTFFEAWYLAQEAAREVLPAFGTLYQPGAGRAYALTNGVLSNYAPFSDGKKVLAARKFQIKWELILGAPV